MVFEAVTAQGDMHKRVNVPNQDAVRTEEIKGTQVMVVCDGVSLKSDHTFSKSEIASTFCADCVIDYLNEHLEDNFEEEVMNDLVKNTLVHTEQSLRIKLSQLKIPFYDCQTTVLIAIFHQGNLYAALAGDGGILFQQKDGSFGLLVTKLKTSSTVEPICYPAGWRVASIVDPENPVERVILATDGIFDNLVQVFRGQVSLNAPLILELFSIEQVLDTHRYKALEQIVKRIETHDDKTIVLLSTQDQAGIL